MRHWYWTATGLAVVAVVGLSLAGCSDRPNDLNTYDATGLSAAQVGAKGPALPPRPAPTAVEAEAQRNAGVALLWDGDVAGEGVRPVEGRPPAPSECVSRVTVADHTAAWRYPTGSTLRHYVSAVPGLAAEAVRAAGCTGQRVKLGGLGAIDAQRAWCTPDEVDGTTCTVLLARKRVFSALEVTAADPARAEEAARRLAPLAALALLRR